MANGPEEGCADRRTPSLAEYTDGIEKGRPNKNLPSISAIGYDARMGPTEHDHAMLRLAMTPGLGPVLAQRAVASLGSPQAVLDASEHALATIKGIGEARARQIRAGARAANEAAAVQLSLAARLGVSLITFGSPEYPELLGQIPSPPLVLWVRGRLDASDLDRHAVAIVGSRECSTYGLEQAGRFARGLAQSGITVVSGGARGIDSAAHRGALQVSGGRTLVVLGCGLAHCYPPENDRLFAEIVEKSAGAIISELPLDTPPTPENFPARNRIISGLSLGVLVIEAAKRSGALITARVALEDQNREVFALPGRVDSPHSEGSLELLKSGAAGLVTHPEDVIGALEGRARHHHHGTHGALFGSPSASETPATAAPASIDRTLTDRQSAILSALDEARTLDDVLARVGGEAAQVRADLTLLEIKRRIRRVGSKFEATARA